MEPGNNKSSFKLRSGNKPSPMQLSGVSPMKNDKEKLSREEEIKIAQEKSKKEYAKKVAKATKAYGIEAAKRKRDDANQKAANDYYLKTGILPAPDAKDPEARRLYNKMVTEYDTPVTKEEVERLTKK